MRPTFNRSNLNRRRPRQGFTLIEAMMASSILLMVVVSVTSAISAGQANAFEGQQRIAAVLAAEELMGRLLTVPYDDLSAWDDYTEAPGTLTDQFGDDMTQVFDSIGRSVTVNENTKTIVSVDVVIRGKNVKVIASDADGRVLTDITRFIPEPAEDSVPEDDDDSIVDDLLGGLLK